MVDVDSAFLWETEALRESAPKPRRKIGRHVREALNEDWVTLRDASEATGIPIPTLRKWARRESVPTYLEDTAVGQLRMVSLAGIYERAEELGREIERRPKPTVTHSPEKDVVEPEPEVSSEPSPPTPPDVPEGTMLVPLDAWNKMLNQLGNLHQAGQDLAEARERAAKAETEAKFLRERLSELRSSEDQGDQARRQPPIDLTDSEPLVHIPIEGPEDAESDEITVRDLGDDSPQQNPITASPDSLSLTTYSVEMVKHLYSTWRGRPRR